MSNLMKFNADCKDDVHLAEPQMNLLSSSSSLTSVAQSLLNKMLFLTVSEEQLDQCSLNCSGHGECLDGKCFCEVEFSGNACDNPNASYHYGFSSIFFLLCAISFIQLVLCIQSEFKRGKPRSLLRALRITTQKTLYLVICAATAIRGFYFQANLNSSLRWASNLRSAYYPLVLSGFSLLVCFWAEAVHLNGICIERPGFLSKSFCGFALFNVITYSLFFAELFLLQFSNFSNLDKNTCLSIFNSIYASFMLVVVIFFLIYGVEVYFKIRGAFLRDESPVSNRSQLHQSRLGLVSQAILVIFTVLFLVSDVFGSFWKAKVPVLSRNTHHIMFQIVELAVALWFPCCLWNCVRPEQLWILNPRRILKKETSQKRKGKNGSTSCESDFFLRNSSVEVDSQSRLDCWICYDNEKDDILIQPCACKGDVAVVHHECLKQWLMESSIVADQMRCNVCKQRYNFTRGKIWLPAGLTLSHYFKVSLIFAIMGISLLATYTTIQMFKQVTVRTVTVGISILLQYVCLRFLGINLISAYQRAKFAAVRIKGKILDTTNISQDNEDHFKQFEIKENTTKDFDYIKQVQKAHSLDQRNKLLNLIKCTLHDCGDMNTSVSTSTTTLSSQIVACSSSSTPSTHQCQQ